MHLPESEKSSAGSHLGRVRGDCGLPSEARDACIAIRTKARRHGPVRGGRRVYGEAVREALIVLWDASDPYVRGNWQKAFLPVPIGQWRAMAGLSWARLRGRQCYT